MTYARIDGDMRRSSNVFIPETRWERRFFRAWGETPHLGREGDERWGRM